MTKKFIQRQYVKDSSSTFTKALFVGLPVLGAVILPFAEAHFSKDTGPQYFKYPLVTFLNLTLISQSIHSAKNLYTKSQQGTQKVLDVEIDGKETKVVAKGTLPISTFLSDVSLIAGTAGYFAAPDLFIKGCSAVGGIISHLIFKAFADDSNNHISSNSQGGVQQINSNNINSNNTNINIGNSYCGRNNISEAELALLGVAATVGLSSYLISDSTPGDFRYKFYSQNVTELPIKLEWHNDDYALVNEYGEEISVI